MLLCDDNPMVLDKIIAKKIGLNESIVLYQVHYWLKINEKNKRNFNEGRYWTFNTISEWQKEFCFWSKETVKNIFKKLRDLGLIVVGNFNKMKMDRTLWYSIDYERLNDLIDECKAHITIGAKHPNGKVQNAPMQKVSFTPTIPETSSEITSEIFNQSINPNNLELEMVSSKEKEIDGLIDYETNYKNDCRNIRYRSHIDNAFKRLKEFSNGLFIEHYINYIVP